ncbi:MAG: DUF1348 family protein [Aquabacterium sp.]|uniref:DUF1348 family protein n=1 Tax=Aquabacterium sp. TaxID=1872578 RepID=UPI003BB17DEB
MVKTAGWALIRDKMLNKEFDATHFLSPMPLSISMGLGSTAKPMHVATILNTLSGLEQASEGHVFMDGHEVNAPGLERSEFFTGCEAIKAFLARKWAREHQYKLKKRLFAFSGNRIGVCFEYEDHDDQGQWWRAYGNENWTFDERGLMARREASINDVPIDASERQL